MPDQSRIRPLAPNPSSQDTRYDAAQIDGMPDGTPDGIADNIPNGDLPDGDMPDGDMPDGEMPDGVPQHPTTSSSRSRTGRRRKVPDTITPIACTNCKKARAKCDGGKPMCGRCSQRQSGETCHYDIHVKTAKDQMIREIQKLQNENNRLYEEKANLDASHSDSDQIIQSLKDDGHGVDIINRLKRGESTRSIVRWLGRPLKPGGQEMSPTAEKKIDDTMYGYRAAMIERNDRTFWTMVTSDTKMIDHLIQLYITWIHPVHMLFDENHFLISLQNCADTYCSPSLVNAVCAMACHLWHPKNTKTQVAATMVLDFRSRFLNEAKIMLKDVDHSKMTNIQCHAVIALAEIGSGLGLMAGTRLRLAAEALLTKSMHEQSEQAEKVSQWGIVTLLTAWAGFTYEKPSAPISPDAMVHLDAVARENPWQQYEQEGDDRQMPTRISYAMDTASEVSKLYRIIHQTILIYCGSRGRVTQNRLFDNYMRYRALYETLPISVTINEEEGPTLPHILFFHIQYHTALVHLFQPLLHMPLLHPDYSVEARNIIKIMLVGHARDGFKLLLEYREHYSFDFISPLQLLCMVHICDVMATVAEVDDYIHDLTDPIRFCLETLNEARFSYPIAAPLQKMFIISMNEANAPIPPDLRETVREVESLGLDELLNSVTRPNYKQPTSQLQPSMEQTLAWDFVQELTRRGLGPGGQSKGKGRWDDADGVGRVNVEDLLNP